MRASLLFWGISAVVTAAVVALCVRHSAPAWAGYLAGINLAALILYGYDKWAARREGRRVPERLLLGLALLGATPGAFLGQVAFRHKTAKRSFRRKFGWIVLLQLAAGGAFLWWGLRGQSG
jgi:uncharacterized membrane protein YsdA (DUF1294 family)